MYTSVRWLNDYLDPPADAEEQAELLTRAGFPLEGREDVDEVDGGDVRQDFEMTSNRGDCVSHVGLAREIAAISGRTLKVPPSATRASGPAASKIVKVTNHEPDLCPLYTARVIRGVKVGPSPNWLADRLTARGDIPRNNLVDATNFVLFELGQPTHVFDLAKLHGGEIRVRMAAPGEPFLPIGELTKEVQLTPQDLVIADAKRAVAIAGVKGGELTAVTEGTTDVLLEAAAFAPVTVRNSSRRHAIASDSSYRFERGVHPGQVNQAADRLAALILELCGGELCEGVVSDGKQIPAQPHVTMRPDRCRRILGVPVPDDQMLDGLGRLGFEPVLDDGVIRCTVPTHRLDIEREIDLIEEVGRMLGHDHIPIDDAIRIRVAPPQPEVLAERAVFDALVGMGFVQTVTHSLIGEKHGAAFLPPDLQMLRVDDERARATPVLRPSILPSLLEVYAFNLDNGVRDVRLFESAATFARQGDRHLEAVNVAFLHPAESEDSPLRFTRGVIDRLVHVLCGEEADDEITTERPIPWFEAGAGVMLNGRPLGTFGLLRQETLAAFGLQGRLCAAELGLRSLYATYPPETEAHALPQFPAIERDLSADLSEQTTWAEVRAAIDALDLEHVEAVEFVTTFRGRQIGRGLKALTMRLRFRASDRTLRHEEVDPQMDRVAAALQRELDATIRT